MWPYFTIALNAIWKTMAYKATESSTKLKLQQANDGNETNVYILA
jgi:hypothetical protein